MALWQCSNCGETKESRCKPKKCPSCGATDTMLKAQQGKAEETTCKMGSKGKCKG